MRIVAKTGREDLAMLYVAEFEDGRMVEFVESVQPPFPREDKWVLIVSTLFGCPVGCLICDAGSMYKGKLTKEQILAQIDFLINTRFPGRAVPVPKFKIQFARLGDPALNTAVLDVLEALPGIYDAPGLMPSMSTIAPKGQDRFFERLKAIKDSLYPNGMFQMQFSIHTTDEPLRDKMIPVPKWSFADMASFGERFFEPGDRKITLNFALAKGMPLDPSVLRQYFNPEAFMVKITPVNPTYSATENRVSSQIDPSSSADAVSVAHSLRYAGYDVIVSIGEPEENLIGSNCGQYLQRHMRSSTPLGDGYTYEVDKAIQACTSAGKS